MNTTEHQQNILAVDDDPRFLKTLKRGLQHAGFNVVCVPSALDALNILHDQTDMFSLVLTDYDMPELSGLDLLRIVRIHYPSVAVIMMTGNGTQELLLQAMRGGCDGFLEKPFTRESLLHEIQLVLKNRRQVMAIRCLEDILRCCNQANPLLTVMRANISSALKHADAPQALHLHLQGIANALEQFEKIIFMTKNICASCFKIDQQPGT